MSGSVIWHDVECGSYAADLPLWEDLAAGTDGPVLELGCGAGRVALRLAERGHEVLGLDTDPALVEALNDRAGAAGLAARAIVGDATGFDLGRPFGLVLAPMQLAQILGGPRPRRAMLKRAAAHLASGGAFAAALVESLHLPPTDVADPDGSAPLPDVREQDGWVYSSAPVALRRDGGSVSVERVRQAVSPGGAIDEEVDITVLDPLSPDLLAAEAANAGLRLVETRDVVATHWHVGSTVCVMGLSDG